MMQNAFVPIRVLLGFVLVLAGQLQAQNKSEEPAVKPFQYTVRTGDTASQLANRWGVPEAAVSRPGQVLKVGATVTIPLVARVKVSRGQTLSAISTKYSVPVETLAKFNHVKPPYRVRSGKLILVPSLK